MSGRSTNNRSEFPVEYTSGKNFTGHASGWGIPRIVVVSCSFFTLIKKGTGRNYSLVCCIIAVNITRCKECFPRIVSVLARDQDPVEKFGIILELRDLHKPKYHVFCVKQIFRSSWKKVFVEFNFCNFPKLNVNHPLILLKCSF